MKGMVVSSKQDEDSCNTWTTYLQHAIHNMDSSQEFNYVPDIAGLLETLSHSLGTADFHEGARIESSRIVAETVPASAQRKMTQVVRYLHDTTSRGLRSEV